MGAPDPWHCESYTHGCPSPLALQTLHPRVPLSPAIAHPAPTSAPHPCPYKLSTHGCSLPLPALHPWVPLTPVGPPPGFEGALCERDADDCTPDPCHHGTCVDGIASFSCACAPGFTGYRCELQLDECHSQPCRHGGKCIDRIASYQCNCPPGTAGTGWGGRAGEGMGGASLGAGWGVEVVVGPIWVWGGG
ncbi:Fibropellin-3-like protein [Aix galericulata]|nr:Fibropellin-3-like protein [Aix galericulata]